MRRNVCIYVWWSGRSVSTAGGQWADKSPWIIQSVTSSEYVSIALVILHGKLIRRIILSSVACLAVTGLANFRKKKALTIKCVCFFCELNRLTQYCFVYSLLVFRQHVSVYLCHLQVTLGTCSRILKCFSTGAYIIIVTYACVIGLCSLVTILCVVIFHFCCVGTVYFMCCRFHLCFVDCLLLLLSLFCIIIWVF
jgi:hypothetical protein